MYTIAVVLHVVVAVLGVGAVGGVTIAISSARRLATPPAQVATWLGPLLRYTRVSLALMMVTGVWMEVVAGGAHRNFWWFRISVLLIVLAFFFQRRATAALANVSAGDGQHALRSIERVAWSMCGTIALITALMQIKPF
jgi:hypothetical protein